MHWNLLVVGARDSFTAGGSSLFTGLGSAATLARAPAPANPTGIQTNEITANWLVNGNPAGTSYLVQPTVRYIG